MKYFVTGTLCLCMILSCSFAYSESIRVGYAEFPPFTYTNEAGAAAGLFIETGRSIFKKLKIDIESETSYPPARLMKNIETGYSEVWYGINRDPEERYSWAGKELIGKIEMNLYAIGQVPPIETREDLKGKSVLLLLGYGYSDWGPWIRNPENGVNVYQVRTHTSALETLKKRKVDFLMNYTWPVNNALKKIPVPNLMQKKIRSYNCYVILSKKRAGGKVLLREIDRALKAVKAESPQ